MILCQKGYSAVEKSSIYSSYQFSFNIELFISEKLSAYKHDADKKKVNLCYSQSYT